VIVDVPDVRTFRHGVYENFEGYREIDESEINEAINAGPIVLDTNVFLDLYELSEKGLDEAFELLDSIVGRLWIPHQVMFEYLRGRRKKLLILKTSQKEPLRDVFGNLVATINNYRLDKSNEDVKSEIKAKLDEISVLLKQEQGTALDLDSMIRDSRQDPVVHWIESRLGSSVGPPFSREEYDRLVKEGRERFSSKIPPGFEDGEAKKDQIPEHGTGDFLLWEQTLRYLSSLNVADEDKNQTRYFVLVTNDKKRDWRLSNEGRSNLPQPALPALVDEALDRTGKRLVLMTTKEFFPLLSSRSDGSLEMKTGSSDQLLSELQQNTIDDDESSGWTAEALTSLLSLLRDNGYSAQANVIEYATRQHEGFVSRDDVYRVAPLDSDRLLNRFSLPATRMQLRLVESGLLGERASSALVAVYDGPGPAIGYSIPKELTVAMSRVPSSSLTD